MSALVSYTTLFASSSFATEPSLMPSNMSVAYQENNRGGSILKALEADTGLRTVPQIYIGGKHIGGATELFDACRDGSMAELLDQSNVSWNTAVETDPYSFLPGWLHAR